MTRISGTELVTAMAGEEAVDQFREMFADVAPDFVDCIVEFGFGEIYARPGLHPAERQIAAIAALTANSGWSLRKHIAIGLRVGMTPEQIVAVIMQTIPFVGLPSVAEALLLARQVFDEQGLPPVAAPEHSG
ncbi:carboxymuconolactone decarboxylase family protein [Streptomyces flaveolus]|uniref:carboxymuconolactone decarboxylase family protein n=1 Tax=Streptomyces flaveolus TaxID=67297 RepID=UPI0036F8F1F8